MVNTNHFIRGVLLFGILILNFFILLICTKKNPVNLFNTSYLETLYEFSDNNMNYYNGFS